MGNKRYRYNKKGEYIGYSTDEPPTASAFDDIFLQICLVVGGLAGLWILAAGGIRALGMVAAVCAAVVIVPWLAVWLLWRAILLAIDVYHNIEADSLEAKGQRLALEAERQASTKVLKTITVEQAKELVKASRGDALNLSGLTSISLEVAEALANHTGDLNLYALRAISPEAATALAKHNGALHIFGGVSTMKFEVADALSKHEGDLYLDGLTTLSPKTAKALAFYSGRQVFLRGLTTLSDEARVALQTSPKVRLPAKFKRA